MSTPKQLLVFGATSAIVQETIKLFARDGASFYLCARRPDDLQRLVDDLNVRGAHTIFTATFEAADLNSIAPAIDDCLSKFPDLDGLLIGHGVLPHQQGSQNNTDELQSIVAINFVSSAAILNRLVPHFERKGSGCIAVISSVAGDRGRQSNYLYGATKSALDAYLSGLRQRLHNCGVRVITIKPGFVDTPMTRDFKKGVLWASPNAVAKGIYQAFERADGIVYLPWFWRPIMMVIRAIPENVFKKIAL